MSLQTSIYDNEIYFAISYDNNTYLILEPDGWNKISNHIPIDPKYFGMWSDFLEDKYGMKFSYLQDGGLVGGGQILDFLYNTKGYGPNYLIYFDVGYRQNQTLKLVNRWSINLNEYSGGRFDGGISTSIEKLPFQAKLRSRMSAPCTINDYANMDGGLLTPISTWQTRLHSKTILERTEFLSSQNTNFSEQYFDGGAALYNTIIQPDQSSVSVNELTNVFNQPMGLINTSTVNSTFTSGNELTSNVFTDHLSQYIPTTSGSLKVTFSGYLSLIFWGANGVGSTGAFSMDFRFTPRLIVQRRISGIDTIVQQVNGSTTSFTGLSGIVPLTHSAVNINAPTDQYLLPRVSHSTDRGLTSTIGLKGSPNTGYAWSEVFNNVFVETGDNVYLQIFIPGNGAIPGCAFPWVVDGTWTAPDTQSTNFQIFDFHNHIIYEQLTTLPTSTSDGYRIFDVLTQLLENTTGQKNAFKSSFFSEGGFGYKYILANGYSIRNFNANIYQPRITLESALNSLQAIFALFIGVSLQNGVEYLICESLQDRFNFNVIPLSSSKTFEWKNKHGGQFCFNKVELGYNKFEGLNLVQQDEFCTSSNYLLQWLTIHDNTFNAKSDIIASGYLLEEQRRNQFSANPSQSLTNDNDIFIVATAEPCIWHQLLLKFSEGIDSLGRAGSLPEIGFPIIMFLVIPGDTLSIDLGGIIGVIQFTPFSEVSTYPIISTGVVDKYIIQGRGDWVSLTPYFRGDVVYDVAAMHCYICYVNVISSIAPSSDGANWIAWTSVSGHEDVEIIPPSPNQIFAERNQCFEICANVIDPTTIYNGRLSVKHILYNWRPLLGVGLDFVDPTSNDFSVSQIITTEAKMNALFTSKFISSETNKGLVGDKVLVEINREFIIDYLRNGTNIFSPKGAECKMRIGWNEMNVIRKAIAFEIGDPLIDGGGLNLEDDQGVLWFCQIIDIQYNLVSEIATFSVQKVRQVIAISG